MLIQILQHTSCSGAAAAPVAAVEGASPAMGPTTGRGRAACGEHEEAEREDRLGAWEEDEVRDER